MQRRNMQTQKRYKRCNLQKMQHTKYATYKKHNPWSRPLPFKWMNAFKANSNQSPTFTDEMHYECLSLIASSFLLSISSVLVINNFINFRCKLDSIRYDKSMVFRGQVAIFMFWSYCLISPPHCPSDCFLPQILILSILPIKKFEQN